MTPQAALTKVAREYDLNVHFIKRAAEGINVALHYNHFKRNPEKRAEDFPIADADTTIKEIFGATEKTASQQKSEWFPTVDDSSRTINYDKYINNPQFRDAYMKIATGGDQTDSYKTSYAGLLDKSSNYVRKLEKMAEQKQTELVGKKSEYTTKFASIAREFAKDPAYRVSFDEFESQIFSKHGSEALPYLDLVYKAANVPEERGVHDEHYKLFDESRTTRMFSDFFKSAQEYQALVEETKEAEEQLKFERDYLQEIYSLVGSTKQASLAKEGKLDLGPLNPVVEILGGPEKKERQEDKLEKLQREMMLQDFILRDPDFRNIDPEKIRTNYEQLMRISPELSKEKEIMRAQLLAVGNGNVLSAFDANEIMKANNALTQQRAFASGETPQMKPSA